MKRDRGSEGVVDGGRAAARDGLLAQVEGHYDRFPYPDPRFVAAPDNPRAALAALEWDVGRGRPPRFAEEMAIWVAGCGTLEATEVALRFPAARLLATDVSRTTLEQAEAIARSAGVDRRIEFLRHDLSTPLGGEAQFAYIDCIGVLHHLPEPERGLETLARALHPDGVLDLMVYQEGHRRIYLAFRQALALLAGGSSGEERVALAVRLARELGRSPRGAASVRQVLRELAEQAGSRPSAFADTLLHPHEHTYTPRRIVELAARAGFAMAGLAYPHLWEPALYLQEEGLVRRLHELPLLERAEVLSLLLGEAAPYLDLFLAHAGAPPPVQPDDAALRQGRVEPHGPWRRLELAPDLAVQQELLLGPETTEEGALIVRTGRGASRLPPEAATLLGLVGRGVQVAALLRRLSASAADEAAALRFLRQLLGPAARLLVFSAPPLPGGQGEPP
ncbi:MAG: methyltransferase domain-containing protein [Deltaproteobacteria bacterium]|nr:methyltransferase domain-containing protein [Deltaproteobacteria bacterium]